MTIEEVLIQTSREMGFPEELLKRAADHARTCSGTGPGIEEKLKRDLTPQEIVFYSKYAKWIIDTCRNVPGFREAFLKNNKEVQSDS